MTTDELGIGMRVLVLPPTRKDGEVTCKLLQVACIDCTVVTTAHELACEIDRGAGAILLTENFVNLPGTAEVLEALARQEPWSDMPIVMLLPGGELSPDSGRLLLSLTNVTILERPAPTRTVVSAVQAALRARRRQYEIRQLLLREQEARRDEERANRMKDEFLATLSHELRTPLGAIFGWVQLLKMNPDDPKRVADAVEVIDRNVRTQTRLIEDLLDMSRIISGKIRLDIQKVDISEVIHAAVEAVKPAIEAKSIGLQVSADPSVAPVSADFGRLQQILWNLLTNAVKFTPTSGRIQVRAVPVHSHLEISVADTGEGISPEFLPHLFERFSQADGSITRRHGGLGLGLSIVKTLVELHGGSIEAQSAGASQGSTFIVRLPLCVANGNRVAVDATRGSTSRSDGSFTADLHKLQGVRVLVVDDEPDAREFVKNLLTDSNAVPALAASASEARSLLKVFQPDVIVSDIGMPDEDGYVFIRKVRGGGITAPAIALTAFARSEDRARSIEAGFQAHLPKPVEPEELLSTILRLHQK